MNQIAPLAKLQAIEHPLAYSLGINIYVLRLDQAFGPLSGNKYFKLINNIQRVRAEGFRRMISFGGAFSNHIHALAMVGRMAGISTVGMIRGELTHPLNPTLQDAVNAGMELHYLSREQYRRRNDPEFIQQMTLDFSNSLIIPEGGSNLDGVIGCQQIVDQIQQHRGDDYDVVVLPCGTGATLAGVISACDSSKHLYGFSVLKNAHYIDHDVGIFLQKLGKGKRNNWNILHDCHFGGYAKIKSELLDFIDGFNNNYGIALEPIYTGKMFYGFFQLLKKSPELFSSGEKVILVHTGGMQGLRGMQPIIERVRLLSAV